MKIALVVKDFLSERGGVERFACQFVAQSAIRGHELHVLANRWDRGKEGQFSLHHVPALRSPSLAKLISFPLNVQRVLNERGPFDIVFGLTPLFSMDVYRLGEGLHPEVLQYRYRLPLHRAWKRMGLKSRYLLWMEKRMFSSGRIRKVITISESSRRQLLRHYDISEERVITIYNGVDLERFNPGVRGRFRGDLRRRWGIEEGELAVLFVGNDFRRKGLLPFLRSLALLQREGIRVKGLVVGRDSPRPFLKTCQQLGIGGRVIFTGLMEHIEEAYAGADLFILPTLYDPFGFSCLEAMACGLPVITTTYAGASEIVRSGENGKVVPSPEPNALARAIGEWQRKGAWETINESSWEVAQGLSLERNTEAILSLFAQLQGAFRT